MIISCTSCNKKFEINSDLIPENGRLLQCSKCNHKWFFKKKQEKEQIKKIINKPIIKEDIDYNLENNEIIEEVKNKENEDTSKVEIIKSTSKIKSKYKFINLILVFIITFIALIIVIDTFKSPLSLIIPNIEMILYNLYETLKDIMLFLKDLFK